MKRTVIHSVLVLVCLPILAAIASGQLIPVVAWSDDFDDGDISDWRVDCLGQDCAVVEASSDQKVSDPFSLKVSGESNSGASVIGPEIPIRLDMPFSIELYFRYHDVHWYHMARLGPVLLTIDYKFMALRYQNGSGWAFLGSTPFESYCPPDTWTRLRVDVSPDVHTFDLYANDVFIATGDYGSYDSGLRGFGMRDNAGSYDQVTNGFYDDIAVTGFLSEWSDDFDDGDISDWTVTSDGSGMFIDVSQDTCVTQPFSLKVSGECECGGQATGPDVALDLSSPFVIEFKFRYDEAHWFHMARFGPMLLTLDYPILQLKYHDDTTWRSLGTDPFESYCPPNRWTAFRIEVIPARGIYHVYADDVLIGTAYYGSYDTGLRGFSLKDNPGSYDGVTGAYYDDIAIRPWRPSPSGTMRALAR